MGFVSKTVIQCPSPSCDFAYFALSPDPAGKLRNHFNNLKVRDAEHDKYFRNPFCVFCEKIIFSKTRKGLWKSGMNKHWLLSHSAEFTEVQEQPSEHKVISTCLHRRNKEVNKGKEIAVILSPSQLERLTDEWQLEYELEEGDLITRNGRATHLRRKMIVARTQCQYNTTPSMKRQKTSHGQCQTGM